MQYQNSSEMDFEIIGHPNPKAAKMTIVYSHSGRLGCARVSYMSNDDLFAFIDARGIKQEDAQYLLTDTFMPMTMLHRTDDSGEYDPDAGEYEHQSIAPRRQHQAHERVTDATNIGLF